MRRTQPNCVRKQSQLPKKMNVWRKRTNELPKKKSNKNHPIHDMGVIKFAGGWLRVGRVIPGDAEPPPPPVEKDPAIMKFFNVLARLKAQDAKASMILVEGWIEKDLVGAQTTMERRNAIRSMLFRHQFDIP